MAERFDEELMLGYVEGDLTPAQREQFERRLIADPRLRDLLTQMRRDRTALRDLDPQAAPPQLVEHVNHQLERQMLLGDASAPTGRPRSPRFTAGRIVAYSAVAAMLAVCASIVAITLQTTQSLWTMPGDDKYVVAMDMESSNAPADAIRLPVGPSVIREYSSCVRSADRRSGRQKALEGHGRRRFKPR